MFSEISSVAVSTYRCNFNNSDNNADKIKVYPGETITIGLKAYDLNFNPTYAHIFTRMTKFKHEKFSEYHNIYSYDITHNEIMNNKHQWVEFNDDIKKDKFTLMNGWINLCSIPLLSSYLLS